MFFFSHAVLSCAISYWKEWCIAPFMVKYESGHCGISLNALLSILITKFNNYKLLLYLILFSARLGSQKFEQTSIRHLKKSRTDGVEYELCGRGWLAGRSLRGDWAYPRFPASGWSRRSVTASRLGTVGRHRELQCGQKWTRSAQTVSGWDD